MARNKPKYRGKTIHKIQNKVTGEIGNPLINELLDSEQEVVLVVMGTVGNVGYKSTDGGTVCVQTIKSQSGFIVTDELDGYDILHKLHADRARELDELLGQSSGGEDEDAS